jgi:NAD-reducing hydrogenase large subunit
MGLIQKTYGGDGEDGDGALELYDGLLRLRGANGRVIDEFEAFEYADKIGEHVEPWSYLKFPFYRPFGYPQGAYRVGPLGRINAGDFITTPKANAELKKLREAGKDSNGVVHYTLYYHYARLIEALYAAERLGELFEDPDVCSNELHCPQGNELNPEGVGIVEAPRGTLIHHYNVDERGAITAANLIVATGHNNIAINRGVEQVAREFITDGTNVKEGVLNRMEHVIRCYDPCLSCSTHALGKMPLELEIMNPEREVLKTIIQE